MVLRYKFDYDDVWDIDFEYEPEANLDECVDDWFDESDTAPTREEMKKLGYDFDNHKDRNAWAEESDYFTDFAREWYRDAAHDAFMHDSDVYEQVEETHEYRRDPYSYYGVSRWDFV